VRPVLLASLLAAVAMTTACASERLRVYKSAGTRQCEAGAAAAPEALQQPLEAAGVRVLGRACGSDGRMRPQVCGAPDGRIVIFDIAPADADAAAKSGYAPLPADAREMPCAP
jgi:hypothetical protein